MKIGIFDIPEDPFIRDVIGKLGGLETEFLSAGEQLIPLKTDCRVVVYRFGMHDQYITEILKLMSLGGTYVMNNPFAFSISNKLIDATLCGSLGIPHPRTFVLPLMDDDPVGLKEPDWAAIGKEMTFPCIFKPFDGFAWESVYTVKSLDELKNMYSAVKGRMIMLVQEMIKYKHYYRAFCINKKNVLLMKWIPRPGGMGEYVNSDLAELGELKEKIINWTIELNSVLDFDMNCMEWCVDGDGNAYVIDAFNETPDVPKHMMPNDAYWWVVDRFVECIREKAESGVRNRNFFSSSMLLKSF
jgi:hypothetical protein